MVLPVNGVGSGRREGAAECSDPDARAGEDGERERPFRPRRERLGRGATGEGWGRGYLDGWATLPGRGSRPGPSVSPGPGASPRRRESAVPPGRDRRATCPSPFPSPPPPGAPVLPVRTPGCGGPPGRHGSLKAPGSSPVAFASAGRRPGRGSRRIRWRSHGSSEEERSSTRGSPPSGTASPGPGGPPGPRTDRSPVPPRKGRGPSPGGTPSGSGPPSSAGPCVPLPSAARLPRRARSGGPGTSASGPGRPSGTEGAGPAGG